MSEASRQTLNYAGPVLKPRPPVRPKRVRLGRRQVVAAVVVLLFLALVALHWPRLSDDEVLVAECNESHDGMTIEYRMSAPFKVAVEHGMRGDPDLGKYETVGQFRSHYDWLRGEHAVRLHFRRGLKLAVESGGVRIDVRPWKSGDARNVKWCSPFRGEITADGVGLYVLNFDAPNGQEEFLDVSAGTNLPAR